MTVVATNVPALVDPAGAPPRARRRAALSVAAGGRTSYSGASQVNGNIALWRPNLKSADADILRDASLVRSRARDLERNHPYATMAVRASRLGVIGKKLRYSCRPDYKFLGIDQDEAMRWGQEFERVWETYAHGMGFFVDAGRRMNFTALMALIHDRDFTDGESFVTAEWDARRKWRTCFQAVDVDRLSNPNGRPESAYLKAGVALDDLSAPLGYWVRDGHPCDIGILGARTMTWSFVRRETDWGRPVALHTFEQLRPGQTRGMSAFASVIAAMKMGQEYTETALQQAILQASYAAVLTSQQNYKDALEVIAGLPPDEAVSVRDLAEENLEAALEHHQTINLRFNGAQIPVLWPGEDLKLVQPGSGAASLNEFQQHATKSYAAGMGVNPVDVSQDYSNVNYSSARMAAASAVRAYEMRRERLVASNAMPMVGAFLEEVIFSGAMKLPKGIAPGDFYDAREALLKGMFLTQGAPMLDPVKERQGQQLAVQIGAETLQSIAAEDGQDYLDILDQQAREQAERAARGLPPLFAGPVPNALPGNGGDQKTGGKQNENSSEEA